MTYQDIEKRYGPRQADIATALCVTQSAVSKWKHAKKIPQIAQFKIQRISKGRLKADMP